MTAPMPIERGERALHLPLGRGGFGH